jgi:hypothetical protein
MSFHHFFRCVSAFVLLFTVSLQTFAQTGDEEPWNRFQYHRYKWKVFHAPDLHLYFPNGYDSLASFVADHYKESSSRVLKRMGEQELRVPNIINILSGVADQSGDKETANQLSQQSKALMDNISKNMNLNAFQR